MTARRSPAAAGPVAVPAVLALALVLGSVLAGCGAGATGGRAPSSSLAPVATGGTGSPAASPAVSASASAAAASPSVVAAFPPARAEVLPVPAEEWARIVAVGAWRPGCPVAREGLRRVEVGYVGFDGRPHRGALVVNADVAPSVARVFTALYDARFPIHRMVPIETFRGDDDASMAADNTSAYNCRNAAQANSPAARSPHANGRAVDLNPYENPWVDHRCGCFRPDAYYGTHRSGRGVVVKGGVPWRAFTHEGWTWQDSTSTDFQHFDTGYPSRPLP